MTEAADLRSAPIRVALILREPGAETRESDRKTKVESMCLVSPGSFAIDPASPHAKSAGASSCRYSISSIEPRAWEIE
jgi:hypothetical protein